MIQFTLTCFCYIAMLLHILKESITFRFKKHIILLIILGVSIFSAFILYFYPSSHTRFYVIILEVIGFLVILKISLLKSILIALFLEVNIAISEYIATTLYFWIFQQNILPEKNELMYILILILGIIIATILDFIFSKYFSFLIQQNKAPTNIVIFLLPFITIYFTIIISTNYSSIYSGTQTTIIFIGLLLSNYVMINLYNDSIKSLHIENNIKLLQQQKLELSERIRIIDQSKQSNATFLHDLLHDCKTLYGYKELVNDDKLRDAINTITNKIMYEYNLTLTNSAALDSILYIFKNEIKSKQIEVSTCIMCNLNSIKYSDQVLLFHSLLEYSITEQNSINFDNRLIDITIKNLSSNIIIKIEMKLGKQEKKYKLPRQLSEKYNIMIKDSKTESTHIIIILFQSNEG